MLRASYGDASCRIAGVQLSKDQILQLSFCLQLAFDMTGFSLPSDTAARSVHYRMAVDFAATHQAEEDLCAAAGL
jgi:hypothetical protein